MIGYLARRTAASFGVLLGAMTVISTMVPIILNAPDSRTDSADFCSHQ